MYMSNGFSEGLEIFIIKKRKSREYIIENEAT